MRKPERMRKSEEGRENEEEWGRMRKIEEDRVNEEE